MPKLYYVLSGRPSGCDKKGTIPVFYVYDDADAYVSEVDERSDDDDYYDADKGLEVTTAYVSEDVSEVYFLVAANGEFGCVRFIWSDKWFEPTVFGSEAQAEQLRTECKRDYRWCPDLEIIKSEIRGKISPRKPNTIHVVLTSNDYGLDDDGCLLAFRSLYCAEKYQGDHDPKCEIAENVEFPDEETTAYVTTVKRIENWRDVASTEAFTTEAEAVEYTLRCASNTVKTYLAGCVGNVANTYLVTKTEIIEDPRIKLAAPKKRTKRRSARRSLTASRRGRSASVCQTRL